MAIFSTNGKSGWVAAESVEQRYKSGAVEKAGTHDMKELVLLVVKNMMEVSGRGIFETEEKDADERKRNVRKAALLALKQLGYTGDGELKTKVLEELEKYLWGYYVLDELVNNEDVSDICVLGFNYIRYKKFGVRYAYEEQFIDENDYLQFVSLLAVRNKKSLSDCNAVTYFTDTSNPQFILRFNICTGLITSNKVPILTIRKISRNKYTLEGLIRKGMFDARMADYLMEKAGTASGILFTGKGASGKTTLMNTMLEYIHENESALVIQENDELFISSVTNENGESVPARDVAFLHTIASSGDGKVEYSLPQLTRNGLRMDLDYYIIGEIKGDEAEGFSMASYTGHKCWATVHGMNAYEGVNKLADYMKQATGYAFEDCLRKLIGMEVVIFMKEFRVCEITEICGFDEEEKTLLKRVVFRDGVWMC